jgi:hypothetical protein
METEHFKTGSAHCGVHGLHPSSFDGTAITKSHRRFLVGEFCLPPPHPSYDNGSHAATHHRRV